MLAVVVAEQVQTLRLFRAALAAQAAVVQDHQAAPEPQAQPIPAVVAVEAPTQAVLLAVTAAPASSS